MAPRTVGWSNRAAPLSPLPSPLSLGEALLGLVWGVSELLLRWYPSSLYSPPPPLVFSAFYLFWKKIKQHLQFRALVVWRGRVNPVWIATSSKHFCLEGKKQNCERAKKIYKMNNLKPKPSKRKFINFQYRFNFWKRKSALVLYWENKIEKFSMDAGSISRLAASCLPANKSILLQLFM